MQAAVAAVVTLAAVVALALRAGPSRVAWPLAAAVGLSSLLGVVVTVCVAVPAVGLPRVSGLVWDAKKAAAAAAAAAFLAGLADLWLAGRQRRVGLPTSRSALQQR